MTFFLYLTIVLFILASILLMLVVLIQKGRGGGLASAFGGGGGNTAFGSKTGDVLTWATSVVFGVFLLLAIALNLVANNYNARTTTPLVTGGASGGGSSQTPANPATSQPAPAR